MTASLLVLLLIFIIDFSFTSLCRVIRRQDRTAVQKAAREVISVKESRNTSLTMGAGFCLPEPSLNLASQDENLWLCSRWDTHTCLPSCPTFVCPLTTVRMLSSNLLQKRIYNVKSILYMPEQNNFWEPWELQNWFKIQELVLPMLNSYFFLPLSVGQYLTQYKAPVAKTKNLHNLIGAPCISLPLSNITRFPLSVFISTFHILKCCLNLFRLPVPDCAET